MTSGNESGTELFGIFQVSILHNIVQLLFGVGILMARTHEGALTYLLGFGVMLTPCSAGRQTRRKQHAQRLRPMNDESGVEELASVAGGRPRLLSRLRGVRGQGR